MMDTDGMVDRCMEAMGSMMGGGMMGGMMLFVMLLVLLVWVIGLATVGALVFWGIRKFSGTRPASG
jgi:predicted lipid-binding transport protein (Tim44 family)